jgi:hypothetical protein
MAGFWDTSMCWLDPYSSHGVGVGSVSAVCPRAGGISGRPCHEIIVVVEQLYILYNILLLAEVTGGSASGLGNIATLDHFDALA